MDKTLALMIRGILHVSLVLLLLGTSTSKLSAEDSWQSNLRTGKELGEKGKFAEAKQILLRCLSQLSTLKKEDTDTAMCLSWLGLCSNEEDNLNESMDYLLRAAKLSADVNGIESVEHAMDLLNVGIIARRKGDYPSAVSSLQKGIAILEKKEKPSINLAFAYMELSRSFARPGEVYKGIEPAKKSTDLYVKLIGMRDPRTAFAFESYAGILARDSQHDRAIPVLRQALESRKAANQESTLAVAQDLYSLAQSLSLTENRGLAASTLQEAFTICRKNNFSLPEHADAKGLLAYLYNSLGQYDNAISFCQTEIMALNGSNTKNDTLINMERQLALARLAKGEFGLSERHHREWQRLAADKPAEIDEALASEAFLELLRWRLLKSNDLLSKATKNFSNKTAALKLAQQQLYLADSKSSEKTVDAVIKQMHKEDFYDRESLTKSASRLVRSEALFEQGEVSIGLKEFESVLNKHSSVLSTNSSIVLLERIKLACLLAAAGEAAKSKKQFASAITCAHTRGWLLEAKWTGKKPDPASIDSTLVHFDLSQDNSKQLEDLADRCIFAGMFVPAEVALQQAVILRQRRGSKDAQLCVDLDKLVALRAYRGDLAEAEVYCSQLIELRKGVEDSRLEQAYWCRADLFCQEYQHWRATAVYRPLADLTAKLYGKSDLKLASVYLSLPELSRHPGFETCIEEAERILLSKNLQRTLEFRRLLFLKLDKFETDSKLCVTLQKQIVELDRALNLPADEQIQDLDSLRSKLADAEETTQQEKVLDELDQAAKSSGNIKYIILAKERLADFNETQGRIDRAIAGYEEILALRKEGHLPRGEVLVDLAKCLMRKAPDRAEVLLREAYAEEEELKDWQSAKRASHCLLLLAQVAEKSDKFDIAVQRYKEAIDFHEKNRPSNHPDTVEAIRALGELYMRRGQLAEAEIYLRRANGMAGWDEGNNTDCTIDCRRQLGRCMVRQGNYAEAEKLFKEERDLAEQVYGKDDPTKITELGGLISLYCQIGKYDEAEALALEALSQTQTDSETERVCRVVCFLNISHIKKMRGDLLEAKAAALKAEGLVATINDEASVLGVFARLAEVQALAGDFEEAERNFRKAKSSWSSEATTPITALSVELDKQFDNILLSRILQQSKIEIHSNKSNRDRETEKVLARFDDCLRGREFRQSELDSLDSATEEPILSALGTAFASQTKDKDLLAALCRRGLSKSEQLSKVSPLLSADLTHYFVRQLRDCEQSQESLIKRLLDLLPMCRNAIDRSAIYLSIADTLDGFEFESGKRATENAYEMLKPIVASRDVTDLIDTDDFTTSIVLRLSCMLSSYEKQVEMHSINEFWSQKLLANSGPKLSAADVMNLRKLEFAKVLITESNIGEARHILNFDDSRSSYFIKLSRARLQILLSLMTGDYSAAVSLADTSFLELNAVETKEVREFLGLAGEAHFGTGDYQKSIQCAKQELEIIEKEKLSSEAKGVALAKLGKYLKAAGMLDEALAAFERALKEGVDDNCVTGINASTEVHLNLGELADNTGDQRKALEHFSKAVDLSSTETRQTKSWSHIVSLFRLAKTQAKLGNLTEAKTRAMQACKAADTHINNAFWELSFAEQCGFSMFVIEQRNLLLTLFRDNSQSEDAYRLLVKCKGLLVEGLRQRNLASDLLKTTEFKKKLDRLQVLKESLSNYALGASSPKTKKNDEFVLCSEREQIEREISANLKERKTDPLRVGYDALQYCLREDEVFVDVYRFKPLLDQTERYCAVILSKSGRPKFVDLTSAAVADTNVESWINSVVNQGITGSSLSDKRTVKILWSKSQTQSPKEASNAVSLHLWQPIRNALPPKCRHIYIGPEGALCRLPWQYFAQISNSSLTVSVVDSARELVVCKDKSDSKARKSGLLLVGDVHFGSGAQPLPGTAAEIMGLSEIAKLIKLPTIILRGTQATKPKVVSELANAEYVHLATHGYYNGSDNQEVDGQTRTVRLNLPQTVVTVARNPLALSGILVAPEARDKKHSVASGLTADELALLDLRGCKLVTLSACETARGYTFSGQGMVGLRSSIMAAGAESLITSCWKVDDDATRALMQKFYENLWSKRMDRSKALLEAQKSIQSIPKWSNPYFWSGWILIGNAS